jgi:hypothetical protein
VIFHQLPAVIDESIDFAVPVSLVLFDDWEPEYQKKGLECLQHILNVYEYKLLQILLFSTFVEIGDALS